MSSPAPAQPLGEYHSAGRLDSAIRFLLARTLALAVIVGLALSALAAFLLLTDTTGDTDNKRSSGTPTETSVGELRALAARGDAPIYWAGTAPGTRFEVTETAKGKVFVRYLPPDVKVADKRAGFLTVATYPYPRAYAVTAKSSRQDAMARASAPAGGLAVWSVKRPSSVYVAYPGSDFLVEVFSPKASEARRLVLDGEVGPVDRKAGAQGAPPLMPPLELRP